jgi:predicted transcriptional regulator of viral defense system
MAARLQHWVDERQAHGQYAFLRREAVEESGLSAEAVKMGLQRLMGRGRIARAKEYFFVIVPLEYAAAGGPPASWFIDDLMAAMQRPYYVGLLTAAGLYGASHHAPQEFQVIADRPVRPITVGRVKIRFFTSRSICAAGVTTIKTPTGSMRVSTPETSALDLVRFAKSVGGLDHAAAVIGELAAQLDPKKVVTAAKAAGDIPSAQRLGFILDRVGARQIAEPLRQWIDRQSPRPVPLRTNGPREKGEEDSRWHVVVDRPLEVEA